MLSSSNSRQLVTVIIAVKNGERFLHAAIESVLAQSYEPVDILVVDGHSSDNTAAIAASYPQVRLAVQPEHGVADAYNYGIAAARGELVAFLSHDDLWAPDKLEAQIAYLVSHPGAAYVVCHVKFFLELGFDVPAYFRRNLLESEPLAYIMETLVARKSLFERIGTFDTRLSSGEDVDWFARARDSQIEHGVIDRVLVHKRVHDANLSLNDPATNEILLSILRKSIARKRQSSSG